MMMQLLLMIPMIYDIDVNNDNNDDDNGDDVDIYDDETR